MHALGIADHNRVYLYIHDITGPTKDFFLSGFLAGKKIERVQLRLPSANKKKIASLVDAFRGALGGGNQRPRTCAETI
jgi:hypothetical protein